MALRKNPKVDLKMKYKRTLEIALILSIASLIVAFKFFPEPQVTKLDTDPLPDLITVEDVIQTKHDAPPPLPPQTPLIYEGPDDEILEDIVFEETTIDEKGKIAPPRLPIYDKKEIVEESTPFIAVEQMPAPIGGIQSILKRITYPEMAKRAGITGRVLVTALVDQNGNVESVELVKGIGMGCDDEAMKVIKETKFTPGKQRGKPVRVFVTIPVRFQLN